MPSPQMEAAPEHWTFRWSEQGLRLVRPEGKRQRAAVRSPRLWKFSALLVQATLQQAAPAVQAPLAVQALGNLPSPPKGSRQSPRLRVPRLLGFGFSVSKGWRCCDRSNRTSRHPRTRPPCQPPVTPALSNSATRTKRLFVFLAPLFISMNAQISQRISTKEQRQNKKVAITENT